MPFSIIIHLPAYRQRQLDENYILHFLSLGIYRRWVYQMKQLNSHLNHTHTISMHSMPNREGKKCSSTHAHAKNTFKCSKRRNSNHYTILNSSYSVKKSIATLTAADTDIFIINFSSFSHLEKEKLCPILFALKQEVIFENEQDVTARCTCRCHFCFSFCLKGIPSRRQN